VVAKVTYSFPHIAIGYKLGRKSRTLYIPSVFYAAVGGDLVGISQRCSVGLIGKTTLVKKLWWHVKLFPYSIEPWQTDGRTDRIAISISRTVLTRSNKHELHYLARNEIQSIVEFGLDFNKMHQNVWTLDIAMLKFWRFGLKLPIHAPFWGVFERMNVTDGRTPRPWVVGIGRACIASRGQDAVCRHVNGKIAQLKQQTSELGFLVLLHVDIIGNVHYN